MTDQARRRSILIAAMGGEGGAILSGWIKTALENARWRVQYTAIPGVAQRTGSTTYYIECVSEAEIATGAAPVFSLLPMPGKIDVAIATELGEAARLIAKGYVTADRTVLIASNHRVYSTAEKMAMGDGRMEEKPAIAAAERSARVVCLENFSQLAESCASIINAPVFGAFAELNPFKLEGSACREVLVESGISVETNLRGFELGQRIAAGQRIGLAEAPSAPVSSVLPSDLATRVSDYPADSREIVALGASRIADYQDPDYARLYLDRLDVVSSSHAEDPVLTSEVARQLANWMMYQDVIRVAELKLDPARLQRIARAAKLKPGDVGRVVDYFSPGADELAAILPPRLARWLVGGQDTRPLHRKWTLPIHLKTSTLHGQLLLRALTWLKPYRRGFDRFAHEQANIDSWLARLRQIAEQDRAAAFEFAACARLLKGYGETWSRGARNFAKISAALPKVLAAPQPDRIIRALRTAALADPAGAALTGAMATFELGPAPS